MEYVTNLLATILGVDRGNYIAVYYIAGGTENSQNA